MTARPVSSAGDGPLDSETPIPVSIDFGARPSRESETGIESVPESDLVLQQVPATERAPATVPSAVSAETANGTARWAAIIAPSPVAPATPGVAPVVAPPRELAQPFEVAPSSVPPSRLGLGEPWTVHGPPPSRPACELLALDEFAPPEESSSSTERTPSVERSASAESTPVARSIQDGEFGRPSPSSLPRTRTQPSFDPSLSSDAPAVLPTVAPLQAGKKLRAGPVLMKAGALAAAFALGLVVARRPRAEAPHAAREGEPVAAVQPAPPAASIASSISGAAPSPAEAETDGMTAAASAASKPTPAPFDARVAGVLVNKAASRSRVCKKGQPLSGVATVAVTFAPTGYATAATVTGIDDATPAVRSCIATTFRGLRVPPFVGSAVTVNENVRLD